MLGWCLRREMSIKAYDFETQKETEYGQKLYSVQDPDSEISLHHLWVGGNIIPISSEDMICRNVQGKFYPVKKTLFNTLYRLDPEAGDNMYIRLVNGVMAYNPFETDVDELGNKIVLYTLGGRRWFHDGCNLIEIKKDDILCRDCLGLLYAVSAKTFHKIYICGDEEG